MLGYSGLEFLGFVSFTKMTVFPIETCILLDTVFIRADIIPGLGLIPPPLQI